MSLENFRTGEPSCFQNGEGCKERADKQSELSQRSGGVGAGGMSEKVIRVRQETCNRVYARRTTGGTSCKNSETERVVAGVGDLHSSVDSRDITTRQERREGTCSNAQRRGEGSAIADGETLWLKTPEGIRKLQIALYRKAKANRRWRVYSLYGTISRTDVMCEAMKKVIGNDGVCGVDGYEVKRLKEPEEAARIIAELQMELRGKTYKPSPVLRAYIRKENGKLRPLGIPTVKDRIVQTAAAMLLMPVWEADMHENTYAYRPKRKTSDAIEAIKTALFGGLTEVVDADIAGYFDTIPHRELLKEVAKRVSDGSILKLIKAWLRAPIVERDSRNGKTRILPNRKGTPQGGVISPLLANLYLSTLDHAVNEKCEKKPRLIRYADDMVILCRKGQGKELLERLRKWLTVKGLSLNEEKTRLVNATQEGFNFVGFAVTRRNSKKGKRYYHVEPSIKSCNKLRMKVREILNIQTRNQPTGEIVKKLNQTTRGWSQAFYYGNTSSVYGTMQYYVRRIFRNWLWRKHNRTHGKHTSYTNECLHGKYGLWSWPGSAAWKMATS